MKQKINSRLIFIAFLAAIATTLSITVVYYELFQEQVKKDLRVEAQLLKSADISTLKNENELVGYDELRITWIDEEGYVLYDNDVNEKNLSNHKNRPEVKEAFENGVGESVRNSDTMNMRTFYYAVCMEDGTVLRVSTEARSLSNVFLSTLPIVLLIVLVITILCVFISQMLTKQLIKPIEEMAGNLDDISEHRGYKELTPFLEHIRTQHEDILSSAKSRQDFTANVSHELKTPLTAISGYAELIENKMVDEKKTIHFASEIRKNADRLVSLINDIIRLSELDHKETLSNFEQVDLWDVAKERLELLRSNAREKNVHISLKGNVCPVLSNRGMLVELIDNLVQNAIRYNVPDGNVEIIVEKVENQASLTVKDTGIGIPKDEQSRIFERFYRVDKSRSRETGGTGLGLAIVKHIVELHDGKIVLESEVGKGSSIQILL